MTDDVLQFGPLRKARFRERPNRFLVRCHVDRGGVVDAFLPNPGRLWELLLPGATLWLTSSHRATAGRKTHHTVLAVQRDGAPVFLHTHLTNDVARFLIERGRVPELAGEQIVRAEVPAGASRFDFLLRKGGRDRYVEVKSCTLFGNGVAMFPDAVTERGRRHLVELAALGRRGGRSTVLFLVHTQRAGWFMPDYHTDLAFSQTLLNLRNRLQIIPVAVQWTSDLTLTGTVTRLQVPWTHLRREIQDRGSYLLLLKLPRGRRIEIGRLGHLSFRSGYYVYVGSARRNLSARVARHLRTRKKLHWHIDYLRQHADACLALPIRSSRREECEIAQAFSALLAPGPAGFGSSDCRCSTHLFWQRTNPLHTVSFHAAVQRFRMKPPP